MFQFARLRLVSLCWNARYLLFGPGQGIVAFGLNSNGQLGDGTTTHRYSPVVLTGPVAALRPQQIAAGWRHTLALTSRGAVYAWGSNGDGQMGDGTRGGDDRLVPVRVGGKLVSKRVIQVQCGGYHSLALTDQGEVYAWGWNIHGQLGDGTTTNRALPVRVGLDGPLVHLRVVHISVGTHNLALTSTGEVYGWGDNEYGKLAGDSCLCLSPVKIESIPPHAGVVRVVASNDSSYALTGQGHLYAWGGNEYGQLGDGTIADRRVPQRVPLPHRLVHVAASDHVLALTDQGEMCAWGRNDCMQLGDGTTTDRSSPVRALADRSVTQVAVGMGYSLAVTDRGEVFGWGFNDRGQLGSKTAEIRLAPHLLPCSSVIGRARRLQIAARNMTCFVVR